jgi:hypothetical protein
VANEEHLAVLQQGVETWNAWRRDNAGAAPDLRQADLGGRDLSRVDLRGAQLWRSRLAGTSLSRANLSGASFRLANLSGACLERANLRAAEFTGAELAATDLSNARVWRTLFCNVDLSTVEGLDTLKHYGPSTLGLDTLLLSGNLPVSFLQGVGLPDDLATSLLEMLERSSFQEFYSCFISYSHADRAFALRLYDGLQKHGIRCWLDDHQILPGDDILDQVDQGIRSWDKVILCCSKSSLTSPWVEREADKALQKEERMWRERDAKVMAIIPLDLDGHLFEWESGKASVLQSRLAPDFTGWEKDDAKFEAQLEKLVRALRSDDGARPKPPEAKL